MGNVHVDRARQIATRWFADRETTLYEQFYADSRRGRPRTRRARWWRWTVRWAGNNYTGRIVASRGRSADAAARSARGGGGRDDAAGERSQRLRERPAEVAADIAEAMEEPEVARAVTEAASAQALASIEAASATT